MEPLTEEDVTYTRTNLQYVTGINKSIQFVRRPYKSAYEAQTILQNCFDPVYQRVNAFLRKGLVFSSNKIDNSAQ